MALTPAMEDYLETAPNEYFEGVNEAVTDNAENQAQSDTEHTAESTGEAAQNTAPTSEANTQPEKKILRTAIVYSPVTPQIFPQRRMKALRKE